MATTSTVSADRSLLKRLDQWAERNGHPSGPGHRRVAIEIAIRTLLAQPQAAQPTDDNDESLPPGRARATREARIGGETLHIWADCLFTLADRDDPWCLAHAEPLRACADRVTGYQSGYYEGAEHAAPQIGGRRA